MENQQLETFRLEDYFAKYEFEAPYLLCCSDAESFEVKELVEMASPEDRKLWDELRLGYTEVPGMPALRETIAKQLFTGLEAKNISCFSGAGEGIYCALHALCDSGDHVIGLTPDYQSLSEIPRYRGCELTQLELRASEDWRLPLDRIRKAIQPKTRLITINFPHNPTGQILTQAEAEALVALCRKHDIWLFSDEVYHPLGSPEGGWSTPIACLYEKGLSLGVMSKAYGMAGLRVGWIACQDTGLLARLQRHKHYLSICCSAPAEVLAMIALKSKDRILERNNAITESNLTLLDRFFERYADQFSWVRPQGGCIGLVEYTGTIPMDTFYDKLRQEQGVLLLPGDMYDIDKRFFRIGFGRKNIPEALERFETFINQHS